MSLPTRRTTSRLETSLTKGGTGSAGSASVFGSPAIRNPSKHWQSQWHPDLSKPNAFRLILLWSWIAVFVCSPTLGQGNNPGEDKAVPDENAAPDENAVPDENAEPAEDKPGNQAPDRVGRLPHRPYDNAVLIKVEGEINPLLEQYVRRAVSRAKDANADVVIFEIDSPGGFVDMSLSIANLFADIDWATTIAYVPRQAYSGAAIVSLGCDYIILDPDAQFGDAGMIAQGEDNAFRYVDEKQRSAFVAKVRTLAKKKSHSPALAEAMIDMKLKVYRVRDKQTGDELIMSERELKGAEDPDRWEKVQRIAESGDGRFLTLDGERTVELGLGSANVNNLDELKTHLNIEGNVRVIEWTTVDIVVLILNHPIITGLLFVIGLVALYVELSAPGIGIGGLVASLCFMVFFWSRFLGGTAGWLEVTLFAAGLLFLFAEFFVIPGFGVAGVTGSLLMISSVILASQSFVIPETPRELAAFRQTVVVAAISGMSFAAVAVWVTRRLGKIPILNRLALQPPPPNSDAPLPTSSSEGKKLSQIRAFPVAVGDVGIAESPLRPAGRVAFGDIYVDVITDGSFVDPGTEVRVIDVSANRVRVRIV